MSTNYSQPNWPAIPEALAAKCLLCVDQQTDKLSKQGLPASTSYQLYDAPEEFKEWACQNLPIDRSYFISVQRIPAAKDIPIHTDHHRSSAYNYLLQGDTAYTAWYNSDLKPIEHVKFKLHQWYMLNVAVPHNVFNIAVDRIAVTIGQIDTDATYADFPIRKIGTTGEI